MKKTRRTGLPKQVKRVRAEAEKAIGRGYKATLELLPAGPRKVVKELASQLETTTEELTARGQKVLRLADKRRKALVERVERAARTFERRGERALNRIESRGSKLVARVERTAADVVRPLARRLDIAALSEVEDLSKRLALLERKLVHGARRRAA
jgi:hypothetical protein